MALVWASEGFGNVLVSLGVGIKGFKCRSRASLMRVAWWLWSPELARMTKVVLESLHSLWGECEEVLLGLGRLGNRVQWLAKGLLRWQMHESLGGQRR